MSRMRITAVLLAMAAAVFTTSPAPGCPFCSAPSLTLSEQLAQADAAVLVQWAEGTPATEKSVGSTLYEIKQIVKNDRGTLKTGDRITVPRYRAGKVGDLFLLLGTRGTTIEWSSPLEVSEASFQYVAQAPSPEVPTAKRLEYFVKFLEFPDPLVANDAYGEFANAPYEDITKLGDRLPRERIREWVMNPETPQTRLGLYGLLIGLAGTPEDAKAVEKKILAATEDFRLGIDGLMSGYLLLTGPRGLDTIDEAKLKNKDIPFSETYAAMQALRFMWRYGENRIEKDRLRQSMRILLDRPELADLVIADLARWQDWSIQDRLMELYGKGEFNVPSIKRAIVRYMLVSAKDTSTDPVAGESSTPPPHVTRGREYLEQLRKLDEKTVQEAERFFVLQ